MKPKVELKFENETLRISHKKTHDVQKVTAVDVELIPDGGEKGFSSLKATIYHSDSEIGKKVRKSFVGTQVTGAFIGRTRLFNWATITEVSKKSIVMEHKAHNAGQEKTLKELVKNLSVLDQG